MATALPAGLDLDETRALVVRALDEDLRYGPDITSDATVPEDATTTASVVARQAGDVGRIAQHKSGQVPAYICNIIGTTAH